VKFVRRERIDQSHRGYKAKTSATCHELPRLYNVKSKDSIAMKTSFLQLALASTAFAASNISLPNGWFTIPPAAKITPDTFHGEPRYLTWMADSQIKHGVNPTHDYFVSALLSGVKLAYDRTQDPKYLEFIEKHVGQAIFSARRARWIGITTHSCLRERVDR
jgi:hypothetical protein